MNVLNTITVVYLNVTATVLQLVHLYHVINYRYRYANDTQHYLVSQLTQHTHTEQV